MQLENSHGGFAGKSLINVIQDSLDNGMVDFEHTKIKHAECKVGNSQLDQLQGYVAGMAKALGILRGTSVKTEIEESRERLSERGKSVVQVISDATGE